MFAAQGLMVD